MKRPTRIILLAVAVLGLFMFTPAVGSAQSDVCEVLTEKQQGIASKLADAESKYATAKQEQSTRMAERRSRIDASSALLRQSADDARNRSTQAIIDSQTTESGKTAATNYRTAVETALTTRRQSFDAARQQFRQKTDDLLASQNQAVKDKTAELKQVVNDSAATATGKCKKARSDRAELKAEFVANLKQARLNYNDFRRDKPDIAALIKQYATERDEAFKVAITVFQQSMQEARELLTN